MDRMPASSEEVARRLREGGVLLLETDTLPGLHCRADRPEALARIRKAKFRAGEKPLLVLCHSTEAALSLTEGADARAVEYARRCWPGPFTLILPRGERVPAGVSGGLDTVAIRVPAPRPLRDLVDAAGFPLVSTSANLAGEPSCRTLDEALDTFGLLVDGAWRLPGAGGASAPAPSAIVDLTSWPPRLLRAGAAPPPDHDDGVA